MDKDAKMEALRDLDKALGSFRKKRLFGKLEKKAESVWPINASSSLPISRMHPPTKTAFKEQGESSKDADVTIEGISVSKDPSKLKAAKDLLKKRLGL